jgi:hypothetical protein
MIALLTFTLGCATTTEPVDPDVGGEKDEDGDGIISTVDCDDGDPTIHPYADEVCDEKDNDCDGEIDEEVQQTFYTDSDGDGYGNPESPVLACELTSGFADNPDDCDDTDEQAPPVCPSTLQGDWPTLGGNMGHTGYFPGTVGAAKLVNLWSRTFGGSGTPVAVAEGQLFISSLSPNEMNLYAVDAFDGSDRWNYTFTDGHSLNPPTFADGFLYLQRGNHSSDSQVWCLSDAGALQWFSAYATQWSTYMAPVVADGGVFVAAGSYGGVSGYNTQDGSERFFISLEQYDDWAPAIADGVVYTWVEGIFRAHDAQTGEISWSLDGGWDWMGWSMNTAPVVSDGKAYVIGNEYLGAIDLNTQSAIWMLEGDFEGIPTVANDLVYAIQDGGLKSYATTDGTYDGVFPSDLALTGQAIVFDDALVVASLAKTVVYSLDGQVLDSVNKGGALAVSNSVLYIQNASNVTAYEWVSDEE